MVNTSTKYIVYTHGGTGVRHHHFSTQNNIIDEALGQASSGDGFPCLGFPSQEFQGQLVPFAFMSVHGAADGNHLYTSPGNHTVPVGSSDIEVLVVYAPPGGIGVGGGPGIWVDAFNVDVGQFSDSLDFIKVLNPPTPPDNLDAAKTSFGNSDGEISTLTAENIRANHHVDGVPFLEWKRIVPSPQIVNTTDMHLNVNQTGEIWFAFYQTVSSPSPSISIPKLREMMRAGIFLWTGDDYCGNGGHWFPHGPGPAPFRISLAKSIVEKLNADQQKKLKTLARDYPAIAQTALDSMTKALDAIDALDEIVSSVERR